ADVVDGRAGVLQLYDRLADVRDRTRQLRDVKPRSVVLDEIGLSCSCVRTACHGRTLRPSRRRRIGCFPTFLTRRLRVARHARAELGARTDAKLAIDAREVRLDRLRAHECG